MASKNSISDFFDCVICLECLDKPKVLPCQHSCCQKCLVLLHQKNTTTGKYPPHKIQCPVCCQFHRLPPGGVQGLPADHRANSVLDHLRSEESRPKVNPEPKKDCELCRKSGDIQYCISCKVNLCRSCLEKHDVNPKHRCHAIVDADPGSSAWCQQHQRFVGQICWTCLTPVCALCTVAAHSDHDLKDIVRTKQHGLQKLNTLKEKVQKQRQCVEIRRNEVSQQVSSSYSELRQLVTKTTETQIDRLISQQTEIFSEIDALEKQAKKTVEPFTNSLDKTEQEITSSIERLQKLELLVKANLGLFDGWDDLFKQDFSMPVFHAPNAKTWKFQPSPEATLGSLVEDTGAPPVGDTENNQQPENASTLWDLPSNLSEDAEASSSNHTENRRKLTSINSLRDLRGSHLEVLEDTDAPTSNHTDSKYNLHSALQTRTSKENYLTGNSERLPDYIIEEQLRVYIYQTSNMASLNVDAFVLFTSDKAKNANIYEALGAGDIELHETACRLSKKSHDLDSYVITTDAKNYPGKHILHVVTDLSQRRATPGQRFRRLFESICESCESRNVKSLCISPHTFGSGLKVEAAGVDKLLSVTIARTAVPHPCLQEVHLVGRTRWSLEGIKEEFRKIDINMPQLGVKSK